MSLVHRLIGALVAVVGTVSVSATSAFADGASDGKSLYLHFPSERTISDGERNRLIIKYKRQAAARPRDYLPHLYLVDLYIGAGGRHSFRSAMSECEQVLALREVRNLRLLLSDLHLQFAKGARINTERDEELDKALAEADLAKKKGADKAASEKLLSLIWEEKGDLGRALQHISLAIGARSWFSDAHLFNARLLFAKALNERRYESERLSLSDAFWEVDAAIRERNGKYAEALSFRGDMWLELKQYDDALRSYKTAAELEPDLASAWYGMGNCYAELAEKQKDSSGRMSQFKGATSAFYKVRDLNPNDMAARYRLASLLEKRGLVEDAIKQWEDALLVEQDPEKRQQVAQHIQFLRTGVGETIYSDFWRKPWGDFGPFPNSVGDVHFDSGKPQVSPP